ncbi:MAG: hypothetical protein B7Z20_05435 [Sphingobium sp. 32-64-5]|nr:MAG: hypothetical protein B7Z20_05435 [Sphingobium sp. 32-64-5]
MIQIVIWMLCFYLVVKGRELELTASASMHENRERDLRSAKRWSIACNLVAILFFIISIAQSASMPDLPRSY